MGVIKIMKAITKDSFQMFKQKDNSDDNAEAEINKLIGMLEKIKSFPPIGKEAEDWVNIVTISNIEIEIFKRHGKTPNTGKIGIDLLIKRLEEIKTIPASWGADGGSLTLILDNIHEIYKRYGKAD